MSDNDSDDDDDRGEQDAKEMPIEQSAEDDDLHLSDEGLLSLAGDLADNVGRPVEVVFEDGRETTVAPGEE